MKADLIQERLWHGYQKAAEVLGHKYRQYRPNGPTDPTAIQNALGYRHLSLNAEDMKYSKPNKYAKATWYGLCSGVGLSVGDYLVGPSGTFFVAAMQPLLPIFMVECNRVISLLRPAQTTGIGVAQYGGDTIATETKLMTGWPASILQGTKGEKNATDLPGDVRTPWWTVLVPYCPGVILNTSDIISDDIGRRYTISSPEQSSLGWRLTCALAVA